MIPMELRAFAEQVLLSASVDTKTQRIDSTFTDELPGESVRVEQPVRSENLQFAPRRTAPKMPHPESFCEPHRRGIAHHIMANHELQALEVMAMILLAFPEAPAEFRLGIAEVMRDEQRHTRMHAGRAAELGVEFGSLPVNCYIWKKALEFRNELEYIAGLPLVFESRNLDHTGEFEQFFLAAGDEKSAAIMRAIHHDEIRHVAFGVEWLRKLKPPGMSDWEAWEQHLRWPLKPEKSRGDVYNRDARLAAGFTEEFVDRLADT